MQHLEEGTIHAWLDGALSADEQARVEQHVQQCSECAAMVAEARGIIAGAARIVGALDIVPGGVIPKQRTAPQGSGSLWRSLRLTPLRAALAASLMIAAASLFAVNHDVNPEFNRARANPTAAVSIPPAALPAPAPVPTVANAQDVAEAKPPATTTPNASPAAGRSRAKVAAIASQPGSGVVADAATRKLESVTTPVIPLSAEVVATSTSAPRTPVSRDSAGLGESRRVVQDARADSTLTNAAKSVAGGVARGLAAQRSAMEPARRILTTDAPSMDVAGCYQVSRDSSAGLGALPERFALGRSPATPARSVIYAIDTAGRLDTTVIGTWRDLNTNMVMVNLTARNSGQSFTLAKTVGGFTVQPVASFVASRPLRIVRTNCPP